MSDWRASPEGSLLHASDNVLTTALHRTMLGEIIPPVQPSSDRVAGEEQDVVLLHAEEGIGLRCVA